MKVKKLRMLITEISKTLNDSNPVFMKYIFHYCQNKSRKKHNLHVHRRNAKQQPSCPRFSHLEFFTRKYKIYRFNLRN